MNMQHETTIPETTMAPTGEPTPPTPAVEANIPTTLEVPTKTEVLLAETLAKIEAAQGGLGEEMVGALMGTKASIEAQMETNGKVLHNRLDIFRGTLEAVDRKIDGVASAVIGVSTIAIAAQDALSALSNEARLLRECREGSRMRLLSPRSWVNVVTRVEPRTNEEGTRVPTRVAAFDKIAATALTFGAGGRLLYTARKGATAAVATGAPEDIIILPEGEGLPMGEDTWTD